jgi:hypothetical protein
MTDWQLVHLLKATDVLLVVIRENGMAEIPSINPLGLELVGWYAIQRRSLAKMMCLSLPAPNSGGKIC